MYNAIDKLSSMSDTMMEVRMTVCTVVKFGLIITDSLVARRWRATAWPMTFRASLTIHTGSSVGHGCKVG
jgi:hypothetical protein